MNQDPGKERKDDLTGSLIDACLGQLGAREREELEQRLAEDPQARAEYEALARTISAVRTGTALRPSARFRQSLERRLDAIDEEESVGLGDSLRFRLLFAAHRLRTSPRTRWLALATAASLLFALAGLWRSERPDPREGSGAEWSPDVAESTGPRTEEPSSKELVREQLLPGSVDGLLDRVPAFADDSHALDPSSALDATDEIELPESSPRSRTRPPAPLPRSAVDPRPRDLAIGRSPKTTETDVAPAEPAPRTPIGRALSWLAQQQNEDGSWNPGTGDPYLGVAVTALASASLLAEDPSATDAEREARRKIAERGLRQLLAQQTTNGAFGLVPKPDPALFNQATACLGLLEYVSSEERDGRRLKDGDGVRTALLLGLNRLEDQWQRLLASAGTGHGEYVFEGECAAWASLVLARARRTGLDWQLDPVSESEVRQMLARLRPAGVGREATVAAGRAIQAMLSPSSGLEESDEWRELVDRILFRPDLADPGLRFLVAAAMAPWEPGLGESQARHWEDFRHRLRSSLESLQQPEYGYFEVRWQSGFRGGDVLDTALCVLSLELAQRDVR